MNELSYGRMNNRIPRLEAGKPEIIYVGDPMCSWCWGIANELEKLRLTYDGEMPFYVVLGGLRPKGEERMDERMRGFLRNHWEHVEKASGQPFGYGILEQDSDFQYDTEKACRAVVAMRSLEPERDFEFFRDVQKGFYVDNMDTNNSLEYVSLLDNYDVSREDFIAAYDSEEVKKETWEDFAWAKQIGVKGFPTVVFWNGEEAIALATGYSDFETMNRILEKVRK